MARPRERRAAPPPELLATRGCESEGERRQGCLETAGALLFRHAAVGAEGIGCQHDPASIFDSDDRCSCDDGRARSLGSSSGDG